MNCTFINTTSTDVGAAIYLSEVGNVTIESSKFINNKAVMGGAIYYIKSTLIDPQTNSKLTFV